MREIRTSGSEGGAESSSVPTPYRYACAISSYERLRSS